MTELAASIVLWLWASLLHPTSLRCPPHMWMPEGVRRNGSFECRPEIVGGDDDVLTGRQTSVQPEGVLRMRVYCTGSSVPVQDSVNVWCRPAP